jgi:secreted PhoX family phosphatase
VSPAAPGYTWQVVNAWGDPIVAGAPEFKNDASQSATDQALQAGMHHDGMHFFPLPRGSNSSIHGLLAVNFEYTRRRPFAQRRGKELVG